MNKDLYARIQRALEAESHQQALPAHGKGGGFWLEDEGYISLREARTRTGITETTPRQVHRADAQPMFGDLVQLSKFMRSRARF